MAHVGRKGEGTGCGKGGNNIGVPKGGVGRKCCGGGHSGEGCNVMWLKGRSGEEEGRGRGEPVNMPVSMPECHYNGM